MSASPSPAGRSLVLDAITHRYGDSFAVQNVNLDIRGGVPVEFVAPKEGAIAFKTTIHVVKNSPNKELAFKLIEAAISPEVQEKLMGSPYLIVPTNTKVKMGGEIARVLAKDTDDLKKKFVFQDWAAINKQRSAWIEKFNRDIKL